jgi:peroxiredoxin
MNETRRDTMTIKVGDKVPAATLKVMTKDGPTNMSTAELFGSGKVVCFSVPGAFTPTCNAKHLPGYVQHAGDLRAKGADRVVCTAVNDVFVMDAWGKASGVGDKIVMAADGNAEFAKALGLELNASGFGMGTRGQRFAFIAQDGVITHLNVEGPGEFKVSAAEYVLGQL